jgi:hypothetical protein
MGANSFKTDDMSSGDPKKPPGGSSGSASSGSASSGSASSGSASSGSASSGSGGSGNGSSGNGSSREPPADALRAPFTPKMPSGRVQFDDRGNAIWEWAVGSGAFGREVSEDRLKKLENPELAIADDAPLSFDGVKSNPQGVVKLGRNGAPRRKKKDLRKLSEWLRLKKQAESKTRDDDE